MTSVGVMHMVDTLETGGAERVAVNLVNKLPRERYIPYLCTTRSDGPLACLVAADVSRLRLNRRHRFDIVALQRFVNFIKLNDIRILHAHGTSIFMAAVASLLVPYLRIVWHDHFGRCESESRPVWLYRRAVDRASAVIAVNEQLARWSRLCLSVPPARIWYIHNFVVGDDANGGDRFLPGNTGERLVCVGNLRSQKDHSNLIRALALIVQQVPTIHLLLIGAIVDMHYCQMIRAEISHFGLDRHVTFLGQCTNVLAILSSCDIGVLASVSEGFPLALLEYGTAGLPAIATRVGQCPEVLDNGNAGLLVCPGNPADLAEAVLGLLRSPSRRATLGTILHKRVQEMYSVDLAIQKVCHIYEAILQYEHSMHQDHTIQLFSYIVSRRADAPHTRK